MTAQLTTTGQPATSVSPDGSDDGRAHERTPWLYGLFCLLVSSLPSYLVIAGPLKSNGSPAKMIAIVLFFLAVLGFVVMRRTVTTRVLRPGIVIILAYFALMLLVFGVGLSHLSSPMAEAGKTRVMIMVVACVGATLYPMLRIRSSRTRGFVLGCLAVGMTFNCAMALLQVTAHVDVPSVLEPPGFVRNLSDQGRGVAATLTDRFGVQRAFGTSGHPIEFAVLAAVTVPLTIHFARFATNWQVRALAVLGTMIALLSIPAAVSRSGLIALGVAFALYMWTFSLRGLAFAFITAALGIVVNLLLAPDNVVALWNTVTNSAQDDSVAGRIAAYVRVSDTFRDHPLFGLGLGANPPIEYGFLDNEWLQALVQGGLVGLLGMVILTVGGVFGITAALRSATTARERDQAYAMGGMYLGVLASSYTFDLFSYQQTALVFFILFGLMWSNFAVRSQDPPALPTMLDVPSTRTTRAHQRQGS